MQHPAPHPPSVVRGIPRIALRFAVRTLLVSVGLTAAAMVGALALTSILPVTTLLWAGYAIVLGIGVIGLASIAWMTMSFYRMHRRLIAQAPDVCFNCAYPLALTANPNPDSSPPICPECGHLANAGDLNRGWKRNLGLPE
jgi:hypothetical protein